MYSREDKLRAIELFIKYDLSPTAVIRGIGYPVRDTLYAWYDKYIKNGGDFPVSGSNRRYTKEQRAKARSGRSFLCARLLPRANNKSVWISFSRASCNMDRRTGARS